MKHATALDRLVRIMMLTGLMLATCAVLFGQVDTGEILGVVKDQSGAVVPGANIKLTNEGTGFTVTAISSSSGSYTFSPLKIGTYSVEVAKTGFKTVTQPHVSVSVQQQVVVDITLPLGSVSQTVQVTSAPPLLQTQNGSVGQVVEARQINDLPLNGRNFTFLAQLVAGASMANIDGRGLNQSGSFSANGARPAQNNYLLDGLDNNSNQVDFLGGTNYVLLPPVDAIQEFKVQTADYSAELGRGAGAVLNGTIKSGTNQFHGDAWEFLRNDKFDAANFFENTAHIQKGEYRQNQFGFALGGPVIIPHIYNGKDKTFFFVDYQGTRIRQGQPFTSTVPTALEASSGFTNLSDLINDQFTSPSATRTDALGRVFPLGTVFDPATTRAVTAGQVDPVTGLPVQTTGFVRDPFYQGSLVGVKNFTSPSQLALLNHLPSSRLDANAIKLLQLYPAANGPGLFNNYTNNPALQNQIDQSDIRVDHNFSDKDQMFGRVSFALNSLFSPAPFQGVADGGGFNAGYQQNPTLSTVLSETHSFSPTLINEARVGVNREATSRVQPNAYTLGIPAQFGIQGIQQVPQNGGLPAFSISGLTGIGSSSFLPSDEPNQTTQATENLTKVYGEHTFKGGFEFQHIKQVFYQPAWSRGQFSFDGTYTEVPSTGGGNTGLAQLLLTPMASTVPGGINNVGGADQVYASNLPNVDLTRNYYAGYFQDDWKVRQNLTINLGLRYEYFDPGVEVFNDFAAFRDGPPGQAQFILPQAKCNQNLLSPAFLTSFQKDGIQKVCSSNATLITAEKTDFGPRAGFAYTISPRLVVRGGYGLFYGADEQPQVHSSQNYPFDIEQQFFNPNPGNPITYPNGEIGTFENGFSGIPLTPLGITGTGATPLQGDEFHYLSPYTESYNLTFQYQLSANQTVSLGYVGNQAHHLGTEPGANTIQDIAPPSANPQAFVPFPDFQRNATYEFTEGNSYYHSLQATFERKFSNGFNFLADYTYSKCRTDARTLLTGDIGGYRAAGVPGFGIQGDYALCDFDIPQVFHLSGGYALPLGSGHRLLGHSKGVVNQIVAGWQTHWILTLEDGQPFTVGCPIGTSAGLGCNALLTGQNIYAGAHDVNQWINAAAFANPAPATSVSQTDYAVLGGASTQALGPGYHRLDFSLFKDFRTSESTRLEFRTEVFNLTNTPQFGLPSFRDFTNPSTFGRITSVRDGANDPREIQFALKFYF